MRALFRLYRDAYAHMPPAVWWLCSVALVNRAGTMVVPFLTLWLTTQRGYDPRVAGLLVGVYGVGSLLGTYAGGWLTDRIGAKRVQTASLGGAGVLFVALGQADGLAALLPALFLLGVVADAFRPANLALLAVACRPEHRNKAFALMRLAINLGWSIGPTVGGFLAKKSYDLLFWIDGVTCLLAMLLFVALVQRRLPTEEAASATPGPSGDRSPWHDRPFLVTMLMTLGMGMVFMQFFSTAPLHYERHYGLDEASIGMLSGLNALLVVLFEMAVVQAVGRRRPLRVVAAGALLMGVGFSLVGLGNTFGFAAFAVIVWTCGEILESAQLMTYVANRAGPKNRGRYLGLVSLTYSFGFMLAPVLGTLVWTDVGPSALWWGCLALGTIACAGFLWVDRREARAGR